MAIFQESSELLLTKDFQEKGFVFAPFDLKYNAVLLRPDVVSVAPYVIQDVPERLESLELMDMGKSAHLDLIKKGKQAITLDTLQKVVLSRKIDTKHQVSPDKILNRILNTYPSAFCYVFFHPSTGIWCGATPETFLEVKNNSLKTMSLAGTLPYEVNVDPIWGQKEIEEQEMVTDYILTNLSNKVDDLKAEGPESAKAGLLWHLKTVVSGKLSSSSSLKAIIESLHPTPAVCGLPSDLSKAFILENEGYDRKYYTGFLGELGMEKSQDATLFVNLRCMQLSQKGTSIYVGGGITAESIPENEWEETQNKSKTMLSLL
ncbi:chorismate-binding protein [Flagellimonas sp.]|uniref:chorismate-binding protein n=1 Tax=Flagellimonas sp. TaxID=2058762 RepID=UPI003F4A217C